MKPGDPVVYDTHIPQYDGILILGDTYSIDNIGPNGRIGLTQKPGGLFSTLAFSPANCAHKEYCTSSRMRVAYRYRIYECDKCGAKRSTVEVTVPAPGRGGMLNLSVAARLMQKLSGKQCKALAAFLDAFE